MCIRGSLGRVERSGTLSVWDIIGSGARYWLARLALPLDVIRVGAGMYVSLTNKHPPGQRCSKGLRNR